MSADLAGGFKVGALVSVQGQQVQLVEWFEDKAEWLVISFTGVYSYVKPGQCKLLTQDDVSGADIVMGPASDTVEMASQMNTCFVEKGFVMALTIMDESQRQEIFESVKDMEDDELFSRLPAQFEAGYLGKGGKAKVALLESLSEDMPMDVLSSSLPSTDQTITTLSQVLQPLMRESFGFDIYSRSNLMLRLSFKDLQDEASYLCPNVQAKEADAFLALMARKKITVLHFVGPSSGAITLLPKAPEYAEITLSAEPNGLLMFLSDAYDYCFEPSGETLTLQSFFLEAPLQFEFSGTGGSLEVIGALPGAPPAGAPPPASEPVCVTGMASRDPCNADKHEKLWTALRHGGCDGFLEIPYSRFDLDLYVEYRDQDVAVNTGRSYCRHQGHCEGIDIFDASFFNIPDSEAYGMDPEQRVVMETGWMCLAHSGYDKKKVHKDSAHTGVFVGISASDWQGVCQTASANGVPETFIANRFSYAINLKGPSTVMNTACSASLVACHTAKMHLLFPHDPLDAAIIMGISLNNSPGTWIGNCAGNMLSFVGRSFTFNGSADGYGRGEGCAAFHIKMAEFDVDNPATMCRLAGTHTNSDGRSASLTAPNGPAQQRLLRAILTEAELTPQEVCIYEAHGTGTSLGDPIEVGAVRKVMNSRAYPMMISCSKTNLGHLEGGAGASGFCKVVMAVMHCECAPNQHLREQNPHLDIDGWPGLLLPEGLPMKFDSTYVGVSGFGYGGTNAHAMAYGKNTMTSRGTSLKHMEKTIQRKVKAANVPEIWMDGESYEDWTTTGIPYLSAAGGKKAYSVELLQGGKAVWREVAEPELPESLTSFQIMGSFTDWTMLNFEPNEEVPGLYEFEVTLGSSGMESFQIVLGNDPEMALYPEKTQCTSKLAKVLGPAGAPSRDYCWVIRGSSGSSYRVELFKPAGTVSLSWYKIVEKKEKSTKTRPEAIADEEIDAAVMDIEREVQE